MIIMKHSCFMSALYEFKSMNSWVNEHLKALNILVKSSMYYPKQSNVNACFGVNIQKLQNLNFGIQVNDQNMGSLNTYTRHWNHKSTKQIEFAKMSLTLNKPIQNIFYPNLRMTSKFHQFFLNMEGLVSKTTNSLSKAMMGQRITLIYGRNMGMGSQNKIVATLHTRLRARDQYTSNTLIGGKRGAGPSSHEGPAEYVNARWM